MSTARPTARIVTGRGGVAAVLHARRRCGGREPRQIDAVVDELDTTGIRGELPQMFGVRRGAGRGPRAGVELFALLPGRGRPDVLGVGGTAPRHAAQDRRVPGHRRGRVQEVRVQVRDLGRQFRGEHQGLAESAHASPGPVAPQVPPPSGAGRAVAGQASRAAPGAPYPEGFLMQVLGQIGDRRADLRVHGVRFPVGGSPQREQREGQPAPLQREQFLRDESFRQARIALEDHGDDAAGARCLHPVSLEVGAPRAAGPALAEP